jgi:TatA/E family protein of Tat protein translocase
VPSGASALERRDRMGNLGMPELLMIMVLALLLFGPRKLPEIGKQVGKALGEFKRASNDLKRTIEDEMEKAGSGLDVKLDDPPKTDAAKVETARSELPNAAAPAILPAEGTIARPSETTKTPAP